MTRQLYDNVEDVLGAVNEYVVELNVQGGHFKFPFDAERKPRKPNPFRLSSAGKCTRQLAYERFYPGEGEPMTSRAYNVFMLGDVVHELDRSLIQEVTHLRDIESEVSFYVDDSVGHVKGHTDGILELSDGPLVLDIKTAATASFSRMSREGPSPGYLAQLNAYMDGLGIHRAALWVYDKNTSKRMVLPVEYNPSIVAEVRARFQAVWNATEENLPPCDYSPIDEIRAKKPTGREYLPWQCTYCPYVERCWGPQGFKKVIEGGKVRYIRDIAAIDAASIDELLAV